jgi:hypothetical protein
VDRRRQLIRCCTHRPATGLHGPDGAVALIMWSERRKMIGICIRRLEVDPGWLKQTGYSLGVFL